ncbi:MAG: ArsR/SmtB family transcription factor, partial [Acidimicrobiales bacterium]
AGDLAVETGVSAPAMSKHLRTLLEAEVVSDHRPAEDARVRVFSLRPQGVVALGAWLDQLKAHWDEQLGSFRAHVESTQDVARREKK